MMGNVCTDHVVHIVKRSNCECREQHLYMYLDICQHYVFNIILFYILFMYIICIMHTMEDNTVMILVAV